MAHFGAIKFFSDLTMKCLKMKCNPKNKNSDLNFKFKVLKFCLVQVPLSDPDLDTALTITLDSTNPANITDTFTFSSMCKLSLY